MSHRTGKKNFGEGGGEMRGIFKIAISAILVLSFSIFLSYSEGFGSTKLRAVIVGDPINTDPPLLAITQDRFIAEQVYQGLVTFDLTSKPPYPIIPVLAKSYVISKDARMITFSLRPGVQFHKGYGELTAEDVVFSLRRHLDPKIASYAREELSDVERVEAPDKYTIKIYLKTSSAISVMQNLAYENAGFISSKKAVQEMGDKIQTMPIGTGPYYFDRWNPGEKVILKKFDKYWRTPARIDEIELWVIPEEIVALGALEKGDLDVVPVTQQGAYERARAIRDTYLAEAKGGARMHIVIINHTIKPMNDVRVRKALAHALDIKGICSRIGPLVMAYPSPLAPVVFGATDEFWRYEYDINKSKKLLAEAGYPNGFKLKMIYMVSGLFEPVALEVKNSWSKVIDVDLELIERAVWNKIQKELKYDVAIAGLARYAPFFFAEQHMTGGPRNYGRYSNPEVDKMIKRAGTATTEAEAAKHWKEFQKTVTEDVSQYWVANSKSLLAVKNRVKGVVVMPTPGMALFEKAYIE